MIENIPANFDDNYEKLYMENEQVLENKKVKGDDVDELFFNNQYIKENAKIENDNKPISKEMRRELKFAVKRGDVDYEDVEDIVTVKQYNDLMEEIEKGDICIPINISAEAISFLLRMLQFSSQKRFFCDILFSSSLSSLTFIKVLFQ